MFITEFSLKLDPPQSSLRPWHGHRRRSASIGAEPQGTINYRENRERTSLSNASNKTENGHSQAKIERLCILLVLEQTHLT